LCFSELLMQTEDAEEAEDVNDEERPEDGVNEGGPSVPRDGGDVVPEDAAEGRQGTADGD
jgi:hypothetical protein